MNENKGHKIHFFQVLVLTGVKFLQGPHQCAEKYKATNRELDNASEVDISD
jgi:hypothetical protein